MSSTMSAPQIKVFRPTMEEFKDFKSYIAHMEREGAHLAGIAKVIPPKEWVPRKSGYGDVQNLIEQPLRQTFCMIKPGIYEHSSKRVKAITSGKYAKLIKTHRYKTPSHSDDDELERIYWRTLIQQPPIYGADVSDTLTDECMKIWNIEKLGTILDCVKNDYNISIEGVNSAFLYFGMWKSTFPWHTEDMDLYSINYIHFGEPKTWYAIPPSYGHRFEKLVKKLYVSDCQAILRHKTVLVSPEIIRKHKIPVNKVTQRSGEFMISFPFGYHAGFNHGYNCAESTNFATERWIEYGKRAVQCECTANPVRFPMQTYIQNFQPKRYKRWLEHTDMGCHPESSKRLFAPAPIALDHKFDKLSANKSRDQRTLRRSEQRDRILQLNSP